MLVVLVVVALAESSPPPPTVSCLTVSLCAACPDSALRTAALSQMEELGSGSQLAPRRSRRSVFLHSGMRICPRESVSEVLANHQAYYQLRGAYTPADRLALNAWPLVAVTRSRPVFARNNPVLGSLKPSPAFCRAASKDQAARGLVSIQSCSDVFVEKEDVKVVQVQDVWTLCRSVLRTHAAVCVCVCVSLPGGRLGGLQDLLGPDPGDVGVPDVGPHVSARVSVHLRPGQELQQL